MKKYLFSLLFILVSYVGFSQKGLSYQAVVLDPTAIEVPGQDITGQPLVNGDVWMKFSIYNGSTLQFEEVQKTKTDGYGLVNLMIGSVSSASFNALVWDASQKTLQVYVSFNQGASYTKVSDQKLNYSPYTLFAETAGKLGGVLAISGGGTGATTAADARVNLGLGNIDNTSDAAKPVSTATKSALDLKANAVDVTAALAAKADTGVIKSYVDTKLATGNFASNQSSTATITDADANTKGIIKLAGDLAGTAAAPTVPGLALKANTVDVLAALDLKANSSDVTTALALKANGANVATSLNLKENTTNKSTNVTTDGASDTKYPSVKAVKTYVDTQISTGVSSVTITDADATTKGKIQLAGDLSGTAAAPTVPGLTLKANAIDLANLNTALTNEITTARSVELALSNSVASNTASITANTTSINLKANASDVTTSLNLKANTSDMASALASKANNSDLTSGLSLKANTIDLANVNTALTNEINTARATELTLTNNIASNTASITAEVNRATAAELALSNSVASNTASITANNSDLSSGLALKAPTASPNFTGIPTAPTASTGTSSTQIATTAFVANATSSIVANSISGTVAVVNGGTGASTLTGLVKGNGTNALTAAVAGTDYQAPLTLTTLGSGSATLSGTTINIPTPPIYSLTNASSSNLGGVKVGNNLSIDGAGVLSANIIAGNITGTVGVSNGGTGSTTLTGYVKGTGTTALTAISSIPIADIIGAAPLASPTFTGIVNTSNINTGVLSATSIITGTITATSMNTTTATAGTNSTQVATTAFVTTAVASAVRLNSDQFSATGAQTGFTLTQPPLGAKVWMFINGTRINNNAYSVSGTAVNYTASINNGYTLVAGDRIQFDYAY
jgi:hypothetical protein